MGLLKLKLSDSENKIACNTSREEAFLDRPRSPEDIIDHCKATISALGLSIVVKDRRPLRLSKASTTYYTQVRLASDWESKDPPAKAATLAHELRHIKQWKHFGRAAFATRYILSPTFRAAVEIECYCESVRAMKSMGYDKDIILSYIDERPRSMYGFYSIKSLHFGDLSKKTKVAMMKSIGYYGGH